MTFGEEKKLVKIYFFVKQVTNVICTCLHLRLIGAVGLLLANIMEVGRKVVWTLLMIKKTQINHLIFYLWMFTTFLRGEPYATLHHHTPPNATLRHHTLQYAGIHNLRPQYTTDPERQYTTHHTPPYATVQPCSGNTPA